MNTVNDDVWRQTLKRGLRDCHVPDGLHEGLIRYLVDRILPGSFLQAVLCNDLAEASRRADPFNRTQMASIIDFLEQFASPLAWGSKSCVLVWTKTPDRFELSLPERPAIIE